MKDNTCRICTKPTRNVPNVCGACRRIEATSNDNRPEGYNQPTQAKPGHTPTPWRIYKEPMNPNPRIMAEASTLVAVISEGKAFAKQTGANAAFIVRAVNAHDELLNEMRMAVNELGKDWQTCDMGQTGAECLGEKCFMAEHRVICHLEQALAKAAGN